MLLPKKKECTDMHTDLYVQTSEFSLLMAGASAALAGWALEVELSAGYGASGEALDGGGLHGGEGC